MKQQEDAILQREPDVSVRHEGVANDVRMRACSILRISTGLITNPGRLWNAASIASGDGSASAIKRYNQGRIKVQRGPGAKHLWEEYHPPAVYLTT